MQQAQVEAGKLYEENAARYESEARRAVARQVHGLLELFDVDVEVQFGDGVKGDEGGNRSRGVTVIHDYQKNREEQTASASEGISRNDSHRSEEGRGGAVKTKRRGFFSRKKTAIEV